MLFTAFVSRTFDGGANTTTTEEDERAPSSRRTSRFRSTATTPRYRIFSGEMNNAPAAAPLPRCELLEGTARALQPSPALKLSRSTLLELGDIERCGAARRPRIAREAHIEGTKELARLKLDEASVVEERRVLKKEREETAKAAEAELKDSVWITNRLKQYEPRVFYFDIIECVRKLAVAGLSAFFPPGSFEKLAFGVIVTTIFLVVTSSPPTVRERYRRRPRRGLPDGAGCSRSSSPSCSRAPPPTAARWRSSRSSSSRGCTRRCSRSAPRRSSSSSSWRCTTSARRARQEARVRNAYTMRRRRDQLRGPAAADPRNLPVGPSEPLASARRTKAEAAVLEGRDRRAARLPSKCTRR